METKKWNIFKIIFLGLAAVCLAENEVLWDLGMVIKEKDKTGLNSNLGVQNNNSRMNAVRTTPYVPPILVSQGSSHLKKFDYNFKLIENISAKNKKQVFSTISNCILNKNYLAVIQMLDGAHLEALSSNDRSDFNYRLAYAFYQTGKLPKALEIIEASINKFEQDRFYILLALVYEAQGDNKKARDIYHKIIRIYPNGDYFLTAKIKSRVLAHN